MTLSSRDEAAIWHPYTQHQMTPLPLPISRGEGAYLFDTAGNRFLDLISSWWVNTVGHANPDIAKAIYQQALQLEHVIFSGFTHEPAVVYAEKLLAMLPASFHKVFYSDNGSTAVEVALKMAYQFWRNEGEPNRKRFIAFHHAYHGDTFGAMAVGKQSGFFHHFMDLLFDVDMFSYPETGLFDEKAEEKENALLQQMDTHLKKYHQETAALIIEPLVQGAAGMRMCRPAFLQKLEKLLRSYHVLIIYDEVMTGMGRTGERFACIKANTTPDIICLSKTLTGGFLPMAVTACHQRIYQSFLGDNYQMALSHGHSYTANPIACAAAITALALLESKEIQAQIRLIEAVHQAQLQEMVSLPEIENIRYCGTIAAFDLKSNAGYGSTMSIQLRDRFLQRGLLIRPLGNVIYLLPPYCILEDELINAYTIIRNEIRSITL